MNLRVEALDDRHDLASFSSGNLELDRWLRDHARQVSAQGTRTYVVLDDEDHDAVVGYFAIAPHVLDRDDAPRKLARGAPRQIPSILLAKLALSEHLHGQGLGAELLVRALGTIIDAARVAGGKLVVVDAIDADAEAFYRHHDFQPLPNRSVRLVMKLSTAARALGMDWP
ncbi:MAG: N-acetyltransferase [Actinomycetota bacterium]|nr:N-acetyltransferase [Actinomycetota bacterium]